MSRLSIGERNRRGEGVKEKISRRARARLYIVNFLFMWQNLLPGIAPSSTLWLRLSLPWPHPTFKFTIWPSNVLHQVVSQCDRVSLNLCCTKTCSNFLQGMVGKLWYTLCKNNTENNPGESWSSDAEVMTLVNLFTELANEKYWEISSLRMEHWGKRKKKGL
jgi:hypothetical protein